MASLADLIISAAIGFLERAASTHEPRDLVLVALLAVLALIAYLLLAIAVFAADGHRRIVEVLQAAAALSPEAVLGWLGDLAIKVKVKLSVAFRFELDMAGNVMLAARN